MNINRKKAILMLTGLETFLFALLVVLFISGAVSPTLFLALALTVALVSSSILFVVLRKFPQ